ncbi:MAG: RNA methyltransferase [Deltaproteobacteria bacterium]|nr:RNA methyltransferase [Deltaproteobacteria bacterium]
MPSTIKLDNISIVLVNPQIPENIGAAARAMHNMGINHLILVHPKNHDPSRIKIMATGSSNCVLEKMEIHDDLLSAVGSFQYIVGTTARIGNQRPALTDPHHLAEDLIPISQNNTIAVLFGPEDKGLSNDHLRICHTIATIPTAQFSSINLAQAVMIFCYEFFRASRAGSEKPLPRLANTFELEGMYEHLKDVFTKIGFLNPQNPEHWMLNIRRLASKYPLKAKEVRTVRGICRQIDWYTEQLDKELDEKKDEDI